MASKSVTAELGTGLEARPVAMPVQAASQSESNIYLECGDKRVNAKSIMGMMTLALCPGEQVNLTAEGVDEMAAVEKIESYLQGKQSVTRKEGCCGITGY